MHSEGGEWWRTKGKKDKLMQGREKRVYTAEKGDSAAVMLQNHKNNAEDEWKWHGRERDRKKVVNPFIQKLAHEPTLFLSWTHPREQFCCVRYSAVPLNPADCCRIFNLIHIVEPTQDCCPAEVQTFLGALQKGAHAHPVVHLKMSSNCQFNSGA